jgi:hypothetical protein
MARQWGRYRFHMTPLAILLPQQEGFPMYDVLFVALGIAGFAVCVGYVYLCDRL